MDMKKAAALMECVLDLKRGIVAVDIAQTEAEFASWTIPKLKGRLSFCSMVRLASMGYQRKALGENFGCRGAAEVFRFVEPGRESVTGERMFSFGLYAELETAQKVQLSMATLVEPCSGIAVMPLATCVREPDSLVLIVNSYQSMRLVQAWAYHHGPVTNLSLLGNRGICSECVARPLSTGELHISPLCSNTRHLAKWTDGEMGIGIPFEQLESLLDGLVQTIPAVESEQRKHAIIERCTLAEVELSLPVRKSYFSRR